VNKLNWPKIVKTELAPRLPGFVAQGRLLYRRPVDEILRAFQVEVSGFTNSAVYVWCFVLPLYVPRDHLSFDCGMRLGQADSGSERWIVDESKAMIEAMAQVMNKEGLKFLNRIHTTTDLANHLLTDAGSLHNPHAMEAIAYSQVLAGEVVQAKQSMENLDRSLDLSVSWEREMSERVTLIREFISSNDVVSARGQLAAWRRFSMEKLRVS
jgi:hypothetical protein